MLPDNNFFFNRDLQCCVYTNQNYKQYFPVYYAAVYDLQKHPFHSEEKNFYKIHDIVSVGS